MKLSSPNTLNDFEDRDVKFYVYGISIICNFTFVLIHYKILYLFDIN